MRNLRVNILVIFLGVVIAAFVIWKLRHASGNRLAKDALDLECKLGAITASQRDQLKPLVDPELLEREELTTAMLETLGVLPERVIKALLNQRIKFGVLNPRSQYDLSKDAQFGLFENGEILPAALMSEDSTAAVIKLAPLLDRAEGPILFEPKIIKDGHYISAIRARTVTMALWALFEKDLDHSLKMSVLQSPAKSGPLEAYLRFKKALAARIKLDEGSKRFYLNRFPGAGVLAPDFETRVFLQSVAAYYCGGKTRTSLQSNQPEAYSFLTSNVTCLLGRPADIDATSFQKVCPEGL